MVADKVATADILLMPLAPLQRLPVHRQILPFPKPRSAVWHPSSVMTASKALTPHDFTTISEKRFHLIDCALHAQRHAVLNTMCSESFDISFHLPVVPKSDCYVSNGFSNLMDSANLCAWSFHKQVPWSAKWFLSNIKNNDTLFWKLV